MITGRSPIFRRAGRGLLRVMLHLLQGLAGLVLLLAVGGTILSLWWGHEFTQRLETLRAQEQPLTMREAAPKPVPAGENAAGLYQQVFKLDPSRPPSAASVNARSLELPGVTSRDGDLLSKYCGKPSAEGDARAATLLSRPQAQRTLASLEQASQRPACVFPINWEDPRQHDYPGMLKFYTAARIIAANGVLESRRGRPEEASRWFAVGVRMARHAGSFPTLLGQLTRNAVLGILWRAALSVANQPAPPGPHTTDLDQALAEQDLGAGFLAAARMQRVLDLEVFQVRLLRGVALGNLDYWDRALPLLAKPSVVSSAKLASEARLRIGWRTGVGAPMFAPIFTRALGKRDTAQAEVDLWRLALALRKYQAARGQYPASLDQLGPPVLQDPFSGKPYVYRREGEGFVVYSFGPDMKDDGGKSQGDAQGKYHEEGDIVWRGER